LETILPDSTHLDEPVMDIVSVIADMLSLITRFEA
jgi:hypothetical protein